MINSIMLRVARIVLVLCIAIGITIALIIKPLWSCIVLGLLVLLFTQTTIPYYVIGHIFRLITRSNYVCVTIPFKRKFITIRKKGYIGSISNRIIAHENDHIEWFSKHGAYIGSIVFVIYLIWYGYYDNPVEIRARKAESNIG